MIATIKTKAREDTDTRLTIGRRSSIVQNSRRWHLPVVSRWRGDASLFLATAPRNRTAHRDHDRVTRTTASTENTNQRRSGGSDKMASHAYVYACASAVNHSPSPMSSNGFREDKRRSCHRPPTLITSCRAIFIKRYKTNIDNACEKILFNRLVLNK